MADRITALNKLNDRWDISYTVEKNSLSNSFCVTIAKSDMVDPDSDSEARSLGNIQAAILKNAWVAEAPSPIIGMIDQPEDVTL